MRKRRNEALDEFCLTDEMPFCPTENEMESITGYLDNVAIRRVDNGLLQNKKRRLQSRRKIESKPIDDVLVKSLMRLSNAVSDCFAYEHKAKQAQQQAIAKKVSKAAREQKVNQLAREKLHEEIKTRTSKRKELIRKAVVDELNKHAAAAVIARKEDDEIEKREHNKKVLDIAEENYLKDMRDENDKVEKLQKESRMAKHARRNADNQMKKDNIVSALKKLREGMDQLDSQANKMIYSRIVKDCD